MEDSSVMKQSILKNLQELSEFCVYDFKVTNYYDLIEKITLLNNMVVKLGKEDYNLYRKIKKQVESECD